MYDLNTRDGYATASLYDIMQHPAVLALADDGQLLQLWVGENLPLINEVMYYDNSK
jgi:aromatic ring-cleaving dioxygenase